MVDGEKPTAEEDSSSSESSNARRKRRKKQKQASFSNFTSFDQGGSAYTGQSREEMTAEEKLEEMLHGPMSETDRDKMIRRKTKEREERQKNTVPTPAAGSLKVGDPVLVHGLQSATGQKMNGKS